MKIRLKEYVSDYNTFHKYNRSDKGYYVTQDKSNDLITKLYSDLLLDLEKEVIKKTRGKGDDLIIERFNRIIGVFGVSKFTNIGYVKMFAKLISPDLRKRLIILTGKDIVVPDYVLESNPWAK